MTKATAFLRDPQSTRWIALLVLVYFAAEWVVSASWRGNYTYRDVTVGPLGVPFCGPQGTWPCSATSPVMTIALVVTGIAIVLVATSWLLQHRLSIPHGSMLAISGLALAVTGIVSVKTDYPVHSAALHVFVVFGALGSVLVAVSSTTGLGAVPRLVLGVGGITATIGYFCYAPGLTDWMGAGGAERLMIYPVLIAILVAGVMPPPGTAESGRSDGRHRWADPEVTPMPHRAADDRAATPVPADGV
ncbi:hypothetical protein [Gordonia insulae]|uniref:DUF998 domain-containing protein n=1 Tax=Gordonia insulae TaxID=2420509 RepID=A0A3G8JKX2_9ACTN|nr:hypothetical protein [Gordonia insulae]AZG45706.1 hypothetical protein D7316_02306 [Gordonia insulae]